MIYGLYIILAYGFGNLAAQCLNHTWYANTTSFTNGGDFTLTTDSIVIDLYNQSNNGILNIDVTSTRSGLVNSTISQLGGTLNVNITTPQIGFLTLLYGNITGAFTTVNITYPFTTSKCNTLQTQTTSTGFGILFSDSCTSSTDTIVITTTVVVGSSILIVIAVIIILMVYYRITHNSWVYYKERIRKATIKQKDAELVNQ